MLYIANRKYISKILTKLIHKWKYFELPDGESRQCSLKDFVIIGFVTFCLEALEDDFCPFVYSSIATFCELSDFTYPS